MKRFLTIIMMMVMLPSFLFANKLNSARESDTIAEVYARQVNDDEVEVVWSWDKIEHRDTYEYNVYKKNVLFDGEAVLVAENVTDTVFIDDTWGDDALGVYQWGVEVVNNNRADNRSEMLNIDFEDGLMPEGWITTSEQVYPTTSEWSIGTGLAYIDFPAYGQYSAFSNGTGIDGSIHYNMITSAINLKYAESATLSFDYANVEFLGYVCVLNVKVGSSQQGPWETVFSTDGTDAPEWTSTTVDLSQYIGQTIYIAFENKDYGGMGIGVDNIVLNTVEPVIVWSNPIEKDMYTSVEVTVTSEATESLSGTTVSFVNINEIGNDYEVELDETAYHKWTDFRKGIYEYTVYKKGYESCMMETIEILEETSLECVLTEIILAAEFLYVSPTGLAKWEGEEIDSRSIESYTISLNGVEEATVSTLYYQHENVIPGETYTTTVVANYNTGDSEPVDYTWTCIACDDYDGVSDFEAEYVDGNAVLTWKLPKGDLKTEELHYDDGLNFNYIGQQDGSKFYWAVMFPAEEMMPGELTKVMMFDGEPHTGEFFIYLGGDTAPETLITTQTYECTGIAEYIDFRLLETVTIDGTENLWIVFSNDEGYTQIAPSSDVDNENGGWLSVDGVEWFKAIELFEFPVAWQVRGFIERGADPVGIVLYRDGEILVEEMVSSEIYHDPISEIGTYEYTLEVVYTNYAISCPQTFEFDYVGVAENNANVMTIYPNPVRDNLTIATKAMTRVTITNALGQVMYDEAVASDNEVINMAQYEAGVYIVRITTETGVAVERITVIK